MIKLPVTGNRFYVITGGPGSGKTTLVNELKKDGHFCVAEVARQVIKEQLGLGGDGLPWVNVPLYTELMLEKSIYTYNSALQNKSSITFFDRGIPDSIAYARLANIPIPKELDDAAKKYRYNEPVFMLPPWEEIYRQDEERRESYLHAVITYEMLKKVFNDYGYRIMEVPKLTLSKRIEFLIEAINFI